ncbi:SDR family oxidoreductase [Schlesneria sp. DSM 10557]|uniref:SDR family oxidoreductase n=1 Tax=Schlesneria sp. DSM 10557 TaxID=3044399 RepID=UPI0035A072DF
MSYHLLTGATGLLGNYLLRDLLLRDVPVAVVVRPNRKQTARQRIETALCAWDAELGKPLSRPVVIEGDISQPDLGMDAVDVRWAAEHCTAVIHNAASLTFHSTSKEGEPWKSNVEGTHNVLEFCRNAGIRKFHHVSTAYVAGLRQGKVLETELNVGQQFSNDYECSKLQSETLVRQADFLDEPTVFRPGIIIGDSQTGQTTTYHGYYAALQLVHTIVRAYSPNETGLVGGDHVRLTLTGNETKHLVPVDWVSAVMAHVITHARWHGKTYHLTPKHPVTVRLIRDVLEQATGFYGASFYGAGERPDDASESEMLFYEHIRVYNSYWKMDPEFDTTNTDLAMPQLPCPHVDRQLLMKLSRIAIENGFPTPSKKPIEPEFDAATHLKPLIDQAGVPLQTEAEERVLGLDIAGHGGGQWQLIARGHELISVELGIHADRAATCHLDINTFADLVQGRTTWRQGLNSGSVRITGNGHGVGDYAKILDQLVTAPVR